MLLAPYGAGLRLSRLPTKHFDTYVKPSWKRLYVVNTYQVSLQKGQPMFAYAYSLVAHVTADRKGVTAMEYGVIAAGIVLVVATAATTLGNDVSALFNSIAGQL